ncbi:MAG: antibiotic biosynthesis monooxygenase [Hyphomicrobiaceae bacterium]|nr:antibiotic biosynthesis monooxygenase [Hyphomicrobiaceae bacterium]
MYTIVAFVEAKSGRSAALRAALLDLARISREREAGCLQHDVSVDPLEPSSFLVYAVFEDLAAHQVHIDSPHYKGFIDIASSWIASRRVLPFERISDHGQA